MGPGGPPLECDRSWGSAEGKRLKTAALRIPNTKDPLRIPNPKDPNTKAI